MYILVLQQLQGWFGLLWSHGNHIAEDTKIRFYGHKFLQRETKDVLGGKSCKADFCNDRRVDLWLTKYVLVMEKSTVLKRNYYLHVRGLHTAFLIQTNFSVYISRLSLQDTVHRLCLYIFLLCLEILTLKKELSEINTLVPLKNLNASEYFKRGEIVYNHNMIMNKVAEV